MTDTAKILKDVSEQTADDQDVLVIGSAQVGTDGRITIPNDERERYDIEDGEFVDAILILDDR